LYRSTDRLCRGGAAVKNLAHSASLHAGENGAPSKPGIKHLIAFACLVAHGDMKAVQEPKFQKQWSADKIMEELEKLHPAFYPSAVKQIRTSRGFHVEPLKPPPCPKDELLKIYHECGDIVHRGTLKKLISQTRKPLIVQYPRITALAQKIVNLLQNHIVITRDSHLVFLCVWTAETPFSVSIALAESPSELPPIPLGPPIDVLDEKGSSSPA